MKVLKKHSWKWSLFLAALMVGFALSTNAQMIPFSFWKTQRLYTWIGGNQKNTQTGIYGTMGAASTANLPGTRASSSSWTDSSGNFWLFGGGGYDGIGEQDNLNDVWLYSPSTGTWTWKSGSNIKNAVGTYGTKGTGSTGNSPGSRSGHTSWVDGSANAWSFGGTGVDSTGNWGYLNDLWQFNPTTLAWTWVSGSSVRNLSGSYGTKGTGSTSNYPGGRSGSLSWIDGSGNFWIFGGDAYDNNGAQAPINDLWQYAPGTSKWTWVSGSKTVNAAGVYGTQGVGSTLNTPGARMAACSWIDGSGNLWLFGGLGSDVNDNTGYLNDLWEFTPSSKKWATQGGSNTRSAFGTYGTKGTGSTSNIPGSRQSAQYFKDSSGNFWLFGGFGYDSAGTFGYLNDLWKLNPTTLNWTWVSGSNLANPQGVYGTLGVGSTSNAPGGRGSTAAAWVDSSGNFWIFGGYGMDSNHNSDGGTNLNDLWEFNPTTLAWTWQGGNNTDLQIGNYGSVGVASSSYLPSARMGALTWVDTTGNLYLFGGTGPDIQDDGTIALSLQDFWKYSPSTNQWTWLAGTANSTANNKGTYGTLGTGSTSNIPGGRELSAIWTDSSGNFWLFGGQGMDSNGMWGDLNDLWKYNPTNAQWTWVAGSNLYNDGATYGTLGAGSISNIPGPRNGSGNWTDASGNLWLFGGWGGSSTGWGYLNDLWKFNPTTLAWTWVSGSKIDSQSGNYGTPGTGSTGNIPGARTGFVSWTDSSGNMWLFGGLGYDSGGNAGTMNDLWKFTPSNLKWTWVGGSNLVGAAGTYGTKGVASSSNIPGARYQATGWLDGAGNFWLLGGNANDSANAGMNANDLWKYNPSNNQWTWVSGASVSSTLSGVYNTKGVAAINNIIGGREYNNTWHTKDGTTWFFGGFGPDAYGQTGYLNDLWKLSP
jgi:N-acetylneuraminic acid mutarotase